MKTNLHLVFPGNCREAFAFYETVFGKKIEMSMNYGEAPAGSPVPPESADRVMHTALVVGSMTLMGCDAPVGTKDPMGGFHISVDMPERSEVERIFGALSAGGSVQMPLSETFWTSLFGMCTDKFGVQWMVSVPGPGAGGEELQSQPA